MLVCGDARHIPIRSESVQCVVTSPPYWGLRDYGTGSWEGGVVECDHKKAGANKIFGNPVFNENRPSREQTDTVGFRENCGKCGARRRDSQLGLESTPEAYVAELVAVFREVWRVLRIRGVVFLNLGDSYAGSSKNQGRKPERGTQRPINGPMIQSFDGHPSPESNAGTVPAGLKPKDLCGIPWRVAFALQADGWYLRSDIIWSKPNPMPESVTDRPTKAHEYVFLLTKSERYFYDADAVSEISIKAGEIPGGGLKIYDPRSNIRKACLRPVAERRNRRSVWEVATEPYSGAHFATFPRKLIEPMILAGSRIGDMVLDPFVGSGTTVHVARALGRRGIGLDLKYFDLSTSRIYGPLFARTINA